MKKLLFISVALFTTLSMNAQVEKLIYEMDWAGVEYNEWNYFVEAPNVSYYKATDEGLAITHPSVTDQIWQVRVISGGDNSFSLEGGHGYVVRLTMKVPSDGKLFMQLGALTSSWYDCASVKASDDWQVIDIENQSFYSDISNAHVLLGLGEMVGTTILKKVQVYERTTQDTYRPFVEEGKVWKLGAEGSGNPVQLVEYLYFDGDTIIGGKTCKQMMRQRYVNHDYAESHNISQDHSLSYVGAWYEEDQKVYIYDSINNQFKLMYDFSLDANDILENGNLSYVIGPKQSGGVKGFKGVHRDVWMLRDGRKVYSTPWLEGVGGVYGPTINVIDGELEDPACFLMACYVGDEVIYLNDACEDGATPAEARKQRIDFTHTTKIKPKARSKQEESDACISSSERDVARPKVKTRTEVKARSEEGQSLYGEYNERKLDINLDPLSDAYQVCITDESGNAVYGKAINAGNIVGLNIDISSYPKGHYTVTVENDEELFIGEFETQTAGIEVVRGERIEARGFIYNLQGQRLSSLQKGLNIVNGQKVYVK